MLSYLAVLQILLLGQLALGFNTDSSEFADGQGGVDCARVPPSLWCSNEKLASECGFSELCGKHNTASHNKPIQLTLLYESLCPACMSLIVDELYSNVYTKFQGFVDIELVPYGNARLNANKSITCQHGEEECKALRLAGTGIFSEGKHVYLWKTSMPKWMRSPGGQLDTQTLFSQNSFTFSGRMKVNTASQVTFIKQNIVLEYSDLFKNAPLEKPVKEVDAEMEEITKGINLFQDKFEINKYESCAIHFMPEPFPFIYCLESLLRNQTKLEKAAKKCYVKFHIVPHIYDQILHCQNGALGQTLQLKAAERTIGVWPEEHKFVPWLLFNNVSLQNQQTLQRRLPSAICEWYVGDKRPQGCDKQMGASKLQTVLKPFSPCSADWN